MSPRNPLQDRHQERRKLSAQARQISATSQEKIVIQTSADATLRER